MFQVEKRDGTIVPFDIHKIKSAIRKAFLSLHAEYDEEVIELLSIRVTADFQSQIKNGTIAVEEIQDSVEKVLSYAGYTHVAKAYILYRKQRENVRQIENTTLDYTNLVDSYLTENNFQEKETSLETFSVGGLILSNSAAITSNYWLNTVYDQEISEAHQSGCIHIHDLNMLTADSAGWSLSQLVKEGLGGVEKKISSRPPKHLFSLCNQIVNFLGIMQNEWAGAQSLSSFDTYLAPFVKADQLDQNEVKRCIESFIYGVNMPSRWGTQAPFSNIMFDWIVPADLKDEKAIVGGKLQEFTYGDCQKEMDMIQEAFLDTMLEADISGRGLQFPIPTILVTDSFQWDDSIKNRKLFSLTTKYGTPYFANCIHTNMKAEDVRKQWNIQDASTTLFQKAGGYFGYGENTGSIGTVSINLARIAHLSHNEEEFMQILDEWMDLSARSLYVKRQVLTKFLKAGLYPYTKKYIDSFDSHVSTIGVVAMHEASVNASWLNNGLLEEDVQIFAQKVLTHMKERLLQYSKQYRSFYTLESTPAEGVSYRFARLDKKKYPEMLTSYQEYYTCATNVHVSGSDDVFEVLEIQQKLQPIYTGGACFHVYCDSGFQDWKACLNLVKTICENYEIRYFTISPSYGICPTHGYQKEVQRTCPECHVPLEIWARIAGYYQPVEDWNEGKKQEFIDRKTFDLQ